MNYRIDLQNFVGQDCSYGTAGHIIASSKSYPIDYPTASVRSYKNPYDWRAMLV